ncbi:hypothetical protein BHF71_11345 [Vulcanibacillus modesticaldus]|uniref:N-acetyltransferase domain-containing protein n=1 Tax=Vulcanibacillus modesticaldus TaxID=337097 RepID=A0A1D2YS90_9BACI|nr:GNAT family N-acetyltransferase [Vulcanibacillus modesticaldus]OEF96659.1 hypothetical protein BHF71_11345 [Vulcanibacillus modesticaldus]
MSSEIRLARIEDLNNIVSLLNKVTIDLHTKGILQWNYPWNSDDLIEDIINNYVYLLIIDDLAVGTFSIKDIGEFNFINTEPDNKYLYRIAILPEFQGKGLGLKIVKYSIEYVKKITSVALM